MKHLDKLRSNSTKKKKTEQLAEKEMFKVMQMANKIKQQQILQQVSDHKQVISNQLIGTVQQEILNDEKQLEAKQQTPFKYFVYFFIIYSINIF
jgi:hypothetical protein